MNYLSPKPIMSYEEISLIEQRKLFAFRCYVRKNGLQSVSQTRLVMSNWEKGIKVFLNHHDLDQEAMEYVLTNHSSGIFPIYLKSRSLNAKSEIFLIQKGNIENLKDYISWGFLFSEDAEIALVHRCNYDLLRKYAVLQKTLQPQSEATLIANAPKDMVKWYIEQYGVFITSKAHVYKRKDQELIDVMLKSHKATVDYSDNVCLKNF